MSCESSRQTASRQLQQSALKQPWHWQASQEPLDAGAFPLQTHSPGMRAHQGTCLLAASSVSVRAGLMTGMQKPAPPQCYSVALHQDCLHPAMYSAALTTDAGRLMRQLLQWQNGPCSGKCCQLGLAAAPLPGPRLLQSLAQTGAGACQGQGWLWPGWHLHAGCLRPARWLSCWASSPGSWLQDPSAAQQ